MSITSLNIPSKDLVNQNKAKAESLKSSAQAKTDQLKKQAEEKKAALEQKKKQLEAAKDKANEAKEKLNEAGKNAKGFLKGIQGKDIKKVIQPLLIPILLQFIRTLSTANLITKKIEIQTRAQLKNKGKLSIEGGVFTFTPSNSGNYEVYKKNFESRVNNVRRSIESLKKILNTLNSVIKILNIALSVINIYIRAKQALLKVKLAKITAELALPVPSKPTVGVDLFDIIDKLQKLEDSKKKVEDIQLIILSAQQFLKIFNNSLNKLVNKLNRLKFIIETNNNGMNKNNELNSALDNASRTAPNENYISSSGRSYTLELVTLPNNFRQYQALDAFSKMKVTQTAPSITKTEDQLLDEIKSILG